MGINSPIAFPDYLDIRFYTTGWTFRIGLILFRWNNTEPYKSFEIAKLKSDVQWAGGMTFKEFKAAQKAERLKKQEAREKHESAQ